jgi:hypothetical protein
LRLDLDNDALEREANYSRGIWRKQADELP